METIEENGQNTEANFETIEKSHSAVARERVREDLENLTRHAEELLKAGLTNWRYQILARDEELPRAPA